MRTRSLLLATFALAGRALAADPTPEQLQFFEGKIRPILSEKCYKCHSLETGKSKGGLTLDTRDALLKGGESGPGVKPGNPEGSLLIKAVLYTDKDLQMPPKGEKLSPNQIADLTSWVKMGAPDPRKPKGAKLSGLTDKAKQHWAFQQVKKPEVPVVKNRGWVFTPVDAFIMQKLEEKRMTPTPGLLEDSDQEYGKATLLRRATYDLTGLPPTRAEIMAFMGDHAPDAFAKVVDRLLASPHYGERWGRFWLDTARYADTTGERGQRGEDYRFPYAWTYRDWVIKAFNDDMPYDQFVIQQLAADKVPRNPKANLAALGFITVGEKFGNANDVINDRIDTLSKGFLGLTVACARCHDHMFDPIPTKDYYALHGVFASTMVPDELPVLADALDPSKKADFNKKVVAAEQANKDKYYRFIGRETTNLRKNMAPYLMAAHYRKNLQNAEDLKKAEDLIESAKLDGQLLTHFRGELRENSPVFGPFARYTDKTDGRKFADSVASDPKVNPMVAAAFKGTAPKSIEEVAGVYGKLFASLDGQATGLLDKYAKANSASDTFDANLTQVAFPAFHPLPVSELNGEKIRSEGQKWGQQLLGRAGFDFAKINELEMTSGGATVRAMAVVDSPNPHDSPVFVRGQAGVTGDMVPRRFLEVLSNGHPEPFKNGSGRLELAQAIANKSNPLTARVIVNRVWMHHFGQGFVRTPDDLGTQSETPSHQELIDYLSSYFMEQGWSFKKLHKLIMLSHVYQESSTPNAATLKIYEGIDPENRLLWRANIRRLDFEAFRDSLLVMSGRLDTTIGGQPVNLTDEPYSYRRSVYGYIDRGNVPELLQNFDFSRPDMPNSARTTTIVPQQALFLMNSPMVIDVARRILMQPDFRTAGADFKRVQEIYLTVYQRNPRVIRDAGIDEITMATRYIASEAAKQAEIMVNMKDVTAKATEKAKKRSDDMANMSSATKAIQNEGEVIERRPLNAWETFAQALLFSNEAAYIN